MSVLNCELRSFHLRLEKNMRSGAPVDTTATSLLVRQDAFNHTAKLQRYLEKKQTVSQAPFVLGPGPKPFLVLAAGC